MDLKRYARYLSMAALLIVMSCSGCSLRPEQSYNKSTIAMDTTIQLRAEGKEAKEPRTGTAARSSGKCPESGQ